MPENRQRLKTSKAARVEKLQAPWMHMTNHG